MQITLVSCDSGVSIAEEVLDDETGGSLYKKASRALCLQASAMTLCCEGEGIEDGSTPLRTSNISSGSTVHITLNSAVYLKQIYEGASLSDLPPSAAGLYDCVLHCVTRDGLELMNASPFLQGSEEIVVAACKESSESFKFASLEVKSNREFVLKLLSTLQNTSGILGAASEEIRGDAEMIYLASLYNTHGATQCSTEANTLGHRSDDVIHTNPPAPPLSNSSLRTDKPLTPQLLQRRRGLSTKHISGCLRSDKDISAKCSNIISVPQKMKLHATEKTLLALIAKDAKVGAGSLQTDKGFIKRALQINGNILREMEEWQSERESVLSAVSQNGGNLRFASAILRNDPDIVRCAVQQNGGALRFANPRFASDRKMVLTALRTSWSAWISASSELKGDPNFALSAVRLAPFSFLAMYNTIHTTNRTILLAALTHDTAVEALRIAPIFQSDVDVVKIAVKKNGLALKHADRRLCSDREVVGAAVKETWRALEFGSEELRDDEGFVLGCVQARGVEGWQCVQYASPRLRNDADFVKAVCEYSGEVLQFCSYDMSVSRAVVMQAVRTTGTALRHASLCLWKDPTVCLAAIASNPEAACFVVRSLRCSPDFIAKAVEANPNCARYL